MTVGGLCASKMVEMWQNMLDCGSGFMQRYNRCTKMVRNPLHAGSTRPRTEKIYSKLLTFYYFIQAHRKNTFCYR